MIIHKLIAHHLRHPTDDSFYVFQAEDAVRWLERGGLQLGAAVSVLDLGCGSGIFGGQLAKRGCRVTFADEGDWLRPELRHLPSRRINIDQDDLSVLGAYDLVICSNVIEHLARPARLIESFGSLLNPGGHVYLSWTNWLSPWGGHDFSPFHYLGPRWGPRVFDKLVRRPRMLKPFENLFPTHIGSILRLIRRQPGLRVVRLAPRYYTELAWIMRLPILREFLAWNCAILIGRR
jgi:SAM-dependent methyltransferase